MASQESTDPDEKLGSWTLAREALGMLLGGLGLRQRISMVIAIAAIVGAGLLSNLPALLFGQIVDAVNGGSANQLNDIYTLLGWTALAIGLREALAVLRKYCVEWVATSMEKDQFVSIITSLLHTDVLSFATQRIGAIQKRIDRSVEGIVKLLKLLFLDFGPAIITSAWAIILAFLENAWLGAIMLLAALMGVGITFLQVQSQKGIRLSLFRSKEGIAAKTTELLGSLDYVQATGTIGHEVELSRGIAESVRHTELRHHCWMMGYDAIKQLIEGLGYIAVIAVGAWLTLEGAATPGDILKFGMLFAAVAAPMRELHRVVDEGFEATLRVSDLAMLHRLPAGPALGSGHLQADVNSTSVIVARSLSVQIEVPPNEAVILRDIDIEIESGSVIGLAGPSGCGKSTLVRVFLGVIPPTRGQVLVFGHPLDQLRRSSYSDLVAYVPQVPFLIAGSLRENLSHGMKEEVSDSRLREGLRRASCIELAERDERGLDAEVGEGGRNLSGGERQRLALARVFVREPRLVILDEATSALDAATEDAVVNELIKLRDTCSIVMIAHRLSTLRSADEIVVLKDGEVAEKGSFSALVTKGGVFYDMARRQGLA